MKNQYPLTDKNRLSIVNPEVCKEWDYEKNGDLSPKNISYRSNKGVCWKCKIGHKWKTSPNSRLDKNGKIRTNCPYCSGRKVCRSNCLETKNPVLAGQWHPTKNGDLKPSDVLGGSEREVWWKGKCGHEWEASIKYRFRRNDGCPYCSKNGRVCLENCLSTINPELSKEWHPTKNGGLAPSDVRPNSNKIFWWKCGMCGHEWPASINNRNQGNGCPVCNKIVLLDGTIWDSYTEAYVYLKFKKRGFSIEPHKEYGLGKSKCDFYLTKINVYCEITSFNKNDCHNSEDFWKNYKKKIKQKENFVIKKIKAKFRFIQIKRLNKAQKLQVVREMKK